jgi:hypothetical protein
MPGSWGSRLDRVSQLGGQVAYDLIHWYANEFAPRLSRIVETPVRAMRG